MTSPPFCTISRVLYIFSKSRFVQLPLKAFIYFFHFLGVLILQQADNFDEDSPSAVQFQVRQSVHDPELSRDLKPMLSSALILDP